MPSRKQRRRDLKSKRHEYEFVYVDGEGNELDEAPEEAESAPKPERTNGSKASAQKPQKKGAAQSSRPRREPQAPSWSRAAKRSALLGVFVLIFFSFTAKGNLISVLPVAVLFAAAYVPLMYYIDRAAYRRFQSRSERGASAGKTSAKEPAKNSAKTPAKKR
jgi:hypothetical protein